MLEETKGAEILHKLDQRLADHSLLASGLPLIRCPFCDYAEVDDIYLPQHEDSLRPRADGVLSANLFV
ncbi:Nicotinate phosphoribosyltransferase [Verticillium dahliae VDG1]|nr:Nicotinate phosphoribosyltransferase [Verticillium dahliae VDG1]